MLALYRSGRQSEALEAYRQARDALVEQIGVEPGAELQRLQQAILAQDPALDPPAPRRRAASAPPPAPARPSAPRAGLLAAAARAARRRGPDRLRHEPRDRAGPAARGSTRTPSALIDPESGRITAQYAVGRGPAAVVAGGGSVWVANALDGTVSRIDREPIRSSQIDVGGEPTALAFGAGSLWVAERRVAHAWPRSIPGSNRVVQRARGRQRVPRRRRRLRRALGDVGGRRRSSAGSTSRTAAAAGRSTIGANPTAIAAGAGAIWVASEESGTVTRLDPRTGAVVRTRSASATGRAPSPSARARCGRSTAPTGRSRGSTRARTRCPGRSPSAPTRPRSRPATAACGWRAAAPARSLRIDPDEPRRVEATDVGSSASAVAIADGAVWASAVAPPASHRGGTLRVITWRNPLDPVPIDWLDQAGLRPRACAADLAGVRRARRATGAPPAPPGRRSWARWPRTRRSPADDGRTYVFTLRPGLRFSDGTPVRPEDFRASIERFLPA